MPEHPKRLELNQLNLGQDPHENRNERLLRRLRSGMLSIYCGPNDIGLMTAMAERVGEQGRVVLLESKCSQFELLEEELSTYPQIVSMGESLESTKINEAYSDFTLSLFSLEHASSPEENFDRLNLLTKAGGQLVCAETDSIHLNHYPLPEYIQSQLNEIAEKCQAAKVWNPFVGRIIFQFFNENDYREIHADLLPHHLLCGHADWEDYNDWRNRMDFFHQAVEADRVDFSFDFKIFRREFLKFFENPNRFSYSPLILIEGSKAD